MKFWANFVFYWITKEQKWSKQCLYLLKQQKLQVTRINGNAGLEEVLDSRNSTYFLYWLSQSKRNLNSRRASVKDVFCSRRHKIPCSRKSWPDSLWMVGGCTFGQSEFITSVTSSEWLFSAPRARGIISRTKWNVCFRRQQTYISKNKKKTRVNSLLGNWLVYCYFT